MTKITDLNEYKNRYIASDSELKDTLSYFYSAVDLSIFHLVSSIEKANPESVEYLDHLVYRFANVILAKHLNENEDYDKEKIVKHIEIGNIQYLNELIQMCIKKHPSINSFYEELEKC